MSVVDPRLAVIAGVGGAMLGSHRVRMVIGRAAGYTAKGLVTIAGPVVRPVMHAGEDIVGEALETVLRNGALDMAESGKAARGRAKAAV